jgi:hypothetical protein
MNRATFAIRASWELSSLRKFGQAALETGKTGETKILHESQKMTMLPLMRCQFLIPFADVSRKPRSGRKASQTLDFKLRAGCNSAT